MKLFIDTLGCPKNFNDSEAIAGIWDAAGGEMTDDAREADVLLVNTCGFINDAKTESIEHIFDTVRLAEEQEQAVQENAEQNSAVNQAEQQRRPLVVVTGCLTQRYAAELFDEIPEVDVILGVNEYEQLPEIVHKAIETEHRLCQAGKAPACFNEYSARKLPDQAYSATLRIAEGCNNCCAYCVIPQIRGGYRSRTMENILAEAEQLAKAGTKEIMLIAQDVTEYGRDIYGKLCLPELLQKLCRVDGIEWIRLMYCYEDKITDELIETMASEEKICHYIDIPLQHVSDNVLKAMRRRSTSESIRGTIRRLREAIPDIFIRTTFITGFPGETEEDFDELYDFAEETRFERLGVFAYSREEGTPADAIDGHLDEEVKHQRADSIMRMQVDISREINESMVGRVLQVIVDGIDEEGAYLGRTQYDAPEIDNSVIFRTADGHDPQLLPGDMVNVQVVDAFDYDLVGVLIDR